MGDYLPEPITEKILLNFPIKCLMTCAAVCKSWMSLVKSSTFIQTHTHLHCNNNSRVLLLNAFSGTDSSGTKIEIENISKSHSLLWKDPGFGECKLINPILHSTVGIMYIKGEIFSPQSLAIIGTCNGLIRAGPLNLEGSVCKITRPEALRKQRCLVLKHGDYLALATGEYWWEDFNIWVMKESEQLVFRRSSGNLRSVDCRTGQIRDFGIRGDYNYYFLDSFLESILLLDHANAISY
ncbi:uncharacterized protein LOC126786969 [Argentina anserina]|uniref:uncharacterized protein LOC126786969 n=1 Tax=Argentina anserina TaxID=57926 RepID=UPI0021764C38|nr:uncharacterized protein LOC126786969 [Potentilla anserina]